MTQPTVRDPLAFDALLSSSWRLFRRNWIVALPLVIAAAVMIGVVMVAIAVGAVVGVASRVTVHEAANSTGIITGIVVAYVVILAAGVVLSLWAYTATFGMADAAWERGTATFADGNAAFRTRGGPLIVALIGLAGVAIAALILALPTLFIALLALPLFTMYVLPAVVAGRRGGFEAIAESFRLVWRFFLPSLIACIVLYGISYGISFIGAIPIFPLELSMIPSAGETVPHMPPIPLIVTAVFGYLVMIVLSLGYTGFYAIAIVGMYRSVSSQPDPAAIPPPPPPPPLTSPPAAA